MEFSASEDLADFQSVLWFLKESFWFQGNLKCLTKSQQRFNKRPKYEHFQNLLQAEKQHGLVLAQEARNRLKACNCVSGNVTLYSLVTLQMLNNIGEILDINIFPN